MKYLGGLLFIMFFFSNAFANSNVSKQPSLAGKYQIQHKFWRHKYEAVVDVLSDGHYRFTDKNYQCEGKWKNTNGKFTGRSLCNGKSAIHQLDLATLDFTEMKTSKGTMATAKTSDFWYIPLRVQINQLSALPS